jgi:hypothetical protein
MTSEARRAANPPGPEPLSGLSADDRWRIVAAALRAAGIAEPRPVPRPRRPGVPA